MCLCFGKDSDDTDKDAAVTKVRYVRQQSECLRVYSGFLKSVLSNNKLLTDLSDKNKVFGCLRRGLYVTVLFKQTSNTVPGDFLGRLVLGVEDNKVKIFGATIF